MSEKIYAFLLRCFPSGFRSKYQEESLHLFRDRLRDEKGLSRRLRLIIDLIVDIVGALPQAYRNSYANVAATASITKQLDGIPAFQTLPKEPIRQEVIFIAGVMALTLVAAFTFVLGHANSYRSAPPDGHKSFIESVIESANQPISPDSTRTPPFLDATSPKTGQPTTGPESAPGKAGALASAASQPVQQNASAASSEDSSSTVAVTSTETSSNLPGPTLTAVMVSLSGRWSGSFAPVAGTEDLPKSFLFHQDSVRLTGTAGSSPTEQIPIIHGVVDGNSVGFELENRQSVFRYDLRMEGQALRGSLSIKTRNEARSTMVWLRRVR